jgi:ADP-heptose:LPS heptosyltransferase
MAAAGCPVLSLFGPTTPAKAAPRSPHGRSLCAQDFGSAQMNAIPIDAVNKTIDQMLQTSR